MLAGPRHSCSVRHPNRCSIGLTMGQTEILLVEKSAPWLENVLGPSVADVLAPWLVKVLGPSLVDESASWLVKVSGPSSVE